MPKPSILFLVKKSEKTVQSAGPLPGEWATVTGMQDLDYEACSDMTWAGYPDFAFVSEADAIKLGCSAANVAEMKAVALEVQWDKVRVMREDRIQEQRWRIDRHNDEIALGREPSEDIEPVLSYVQELRDIPSTQTDPFAIVWPEAPVMR
jgi:hypothetical protein